MKKLYTILILFLTMSALAQVADVFAIARSGTLAQIKSLNSINPDAINNVNENKSSPLILACYRGNTEVALYLIESVKDINYNSGMGTALMAAVVKGNVELIKKLIDKKANLNLFDNQGNTALMYAVQFQNVEVVKLLIENGADKTISNHEKKTAFEFAAFINNEQLINLLK